LVSNSVCLPVCVRLKRPDTVALKIIKNIDKYREAAKLEVNVLNNLNSLDPQNSKCVLLLSVSKFGTKLVCQKRNPHENVVFDC